MKTSSKVYTYADDFRDYVRDIAGGDTLEVDQELYDYFLEVLPPVFMWRRFVFTDGTGVGAAFGFAEGAEPVTVFWRDGASFMARRSTMMNPYG